VDNSQAISQSSKLMMLVRAHAVYGHLNADLDPLRLQEVYKKNALHNPDNKFKFPE